MIRYPELIIPTLDLSPFMNGGDECGRKKAMVIISEACTELGVFHIENHGVSVELREKFLELTKTFFCFPEEVKTKSTAKDKKDGGTGYGKMHDHLRDYEYLHMLSPEHLYNGVPTIQPDYRKTHEEIHKAFLNIVQILEQIINDSLGLPKNFLKAYNDDRSWDFMLPMYYTPSDENIHRLYGNIPHQDPNFLTIKLEDNLGGLEVRVNGGSIRPISQKHTLTVVVGDLVQVLTNKKYRHVTHTAAKNDFSCRLCIDFVYTFGPDKWIEPLPSLCEEKKFIPNYRGFTNKDYENLISGRHDKPLVFFSEEIKYTPKYKGFMNKDYVDLITQNFINPPKYGYECNNITYYEI